jgi:ketosteroid isomerase-like protein
MKIAVVAAFVALLASPCVAQTAPTGIEHAQEQLLQALSEGDAATLAGMSTDHAILLPPNSEMVEGRGAIEKYWRAVFAAGLKDVSVKTLQVDEYGGDAVREIGRIRLNAPAPREVVEGKYVILWRRSGENWLLDSVIWNFTQPVVP